MRILRFSHCAFAVFCCLFSAVYVPAQESKENLSSSSTIRMSVNRVDVGVTVTNSDGHFVKGLRSKDFNIFDNGVEQPIHSFASNEEAAQIVFLIEAGAEDALLARAGKSPFAAADTLVQSVSPGDRVAIVTYSDHATVNSEFTDDKLATRRALRDLNVQLRTVEAWSLSLNLAESLAETLDWLATVPGNKTIVLLSLGMDTSSDEAWQAAQEKLQTSPVRILGVSLLGDFRRPVKLKKLSPDQREDMNFVKKTMVESDRWMEQLTSETGGRIYFPKNAKEFHHSFEEISQLVRGEYALEFVPASLDGSLHSIEIKLKHSGYSVEYRRAYRAPSAPIS
jgi:VWFA-related protein